MPPHVKSGPVLTTPTPPIDPFSTGLGGTFTPGGFVPNKPKVKAAPNQAPYKPGQSPTQRAQTRAQKQGAIKVVGKPRNEGDVQQHAATMATQRMLNAHGAHLTVDGVWGPATDSAYQAYLHHASTFRANTAHLDATTNPLSAPAANEFSPEGIRATVAAEKAAQRASALARLAANHPHLEKGSGGTTPELRASQEAHLNQLMQSAANLEQTAPGSPEYTAAIRAIHDYTLAAHLDVPLDTLHYAPQFTSILGAEPAGQEMSGQAALQQYSASQQPSPILTGTLHALASGLGANIVAKVANGQHVGAGDIVSTLGNALLTLTPTQMGRLALEAKAAVASGKGIEAAIPEAQQFMDAIVNSPGLTVAEKKAAIQESNGFLDALSHYNGEDPATFIPKVIKSATYKDVQPAADTVAQHMASEHVKQYFGTRATHTAIDPVQQYFTHDNTLLNKIAAAQHLEVKGATQRFAEGGAHVTLFRGADASTVLHELTHAAEKYMPSDLVTALGHDAEERARTVEAYFARHDSVIGHAIRETYGGAHVPGGFLTRSAQAKLDAFFRSDVAMGHDFTKVASEILAQHTHPYTTKLETDPNAKTTWHTGEEMTVAQTEKLVGSPGARDSFHLHVHDEHGNLVHARHGSIHDDGIKAASAWTHPEHRGRGLLSATNDILMSNAEERGIPVSSWYKNQAVSDATIRQAEGRGREAFRTPEGETLFQDASHNLQGLPEGRASSADAQRIAEEYMAKTGREYTPPKTYAKVDPARARKIAEWYDKAVSEPNNPKVRAAYDAMAKETLDQYHAIIADGYTFEFYPKGHDPYPVSPQQAMDDLRQNKHMYVYPTEEGFGTEHIATQHPLLADSGVKWNGQKVTHNDIFRAVHDFFGHFKEGVGFRAGGEENAWRAHSAMYSDEARAAMTAETRGQNSWVNYGPHGATNKTAKTADTVFADQKAVLAPDWVVKEGAGDEGKLAETSNVEHLFQTAAEHDGQSHWQGSAAALADMHGVDIAAVPPTGEGGRVTVADVERYVFQQMPPADQLKSLLQGLSVQRGKQAAGYSAERSKRFGEVRGIRMNENLSNEEARAAMSDAMKGELPKIIVNGHARDMSQETLDALVSQVRYHPTLSDGQMIRVWDALNALVHEGRVPQKSELALMRHVWGKGTTMSLVEAMTKWQKLGRNLGDIINIPRSVMSSMDVSFGLRQALVAATYDPGTWFRSWKQQFALLGKWTEGLGAESGGEAAYKALMEHIYDSPNFPLYQQMKLAITDMEHALGLREEGFQSNLAERLTGGVHSPIRGSGRAYTGMAIKLRTELADRLLADAMAAGQDVHDEQFLEELGHFINGITGRGKFPHRVLEEGSPLLSAIFFSPRLMASRLQMLNPIHYVTGNKFVRMQYLKAGLRFYGTMATVLAAIKYFVPGASVTFNPRSSDFGKVKLGNNRIDMGGGFNQFIHLFGMIATGQKQNTTTGQVTPLGSGKFGQETRADAFIKFMEGKLSPSSSIVKDWASDSDPKHLGRQFNTWDEFTSHMTPLIAQDAWQVYNDPNGTGLNGIAAAIAGYGLESTGVGLQNYGPSQPGAKTLKKLSDEAKAEGFKIPPQVEQQMKNLAALKSITTSYQGDPSGAAKAAVELYAKTTGKHNLDKYAGTKDPAIQRQLMRVIRAQIAGEAQRYETIITRVAKAKGIK